MVHLVRSVAAAAADIATAARLHCGDIGTALSAAVAGIGVALGRSLLVRDAIAEGRLKPVLTADHRLPSSKVHVLRWSPALIGDPRRARLVSWLRKAAVASSSDDVASADRG